MRRWAEGRQHAIHRNTLRYLVREAVDAVQRVVIQHQHLVAPRLRIQCIQPSHETDTLQIHEGKKGGGGLDKHFGQAWLGRGETHLERLEVLPLLLQRRLEAPYLCQGPHTHATETGTRGRAATARE